MTLVYLRNDRSFHIYPQKEAYTATKTEKIGYKNELIINPFSDLV